MPNSITPLVDSLFQDRTFTRVARNQTSSNAAHTVLNLDGHIARRQPSENLTREEIATLRAGDSLCLGDNIPVVNSSERFGENSFTSLMMYALNAQSLFDTDRNLRTRTDCTQQVSRVLKECHGITQLEVHYAAQRAMPPIDAIASDMPSFARLSRLHMSSHVQRPKERLRDVVMLRETPKEEWFQKFPFDCLRHCAMLRMLKLEGFLFRDNYEQISLNPFAHQIGSRLENLELRGRFQYSFLSKLPAIINLTNLRQLKLVHCSDSEEGEENAARQLFAGFWCFPYEKLESIEFDGFALYACPDFDQKLSQLGTLFPRLRKLNLAAWPQCWLSRGGQKIPGRFAIDHPGLEEIVLRGHMAPFLANISLEGVPELRTLGLRHRDGALSSYGLEQIASEVDALVSGRFSRLNDINLFAYLQPHLEDLKKFAGARAENLPQNVWFDAARSSSVAELEALRERLTQESPAWLKRTLDNAIPVAKKDEERLRLSREHAAKYPDPPISYHIGGHWQSRPTPEPSFGASNAVFGGSFAFGGYGGRKKFRTNKHRLGVSFSLLLKCC